MYFLIYRNSGLLLSNVILNTFLNLVFMNFEVLENKVNTNELILKHSNKFASVELYDLRCN